jgi:mannose-6-phosphate isomerase-like protein (cupin superfamily)
LKITSITDTTETANSHNANIRKKVLLESGEIEHLVFFSQAVFPPGEIADDHLHADITETFYILSGNGTIKVNNQLYNLSAGNCVTVEPGESHEISNTGSENLVINYFAIKTD